jgi:redox-sensitive bicupin YhaK (pirin superfamily)
VDESGGPYGATLASGPEPESVLLPGHDVPLGRYTTVRRLLPLRERRMVGAWCFVDHFGPEDVRDRPGMQVPPHPHTGLQTVTWLVEGEIVHRDSLGSDESIRPGQLNLMTSGRGIAHSEMSPPDHPPAMHGLQLWVALPEDARHGEPRFEHHAALPVLPLGAATATILVGEFGGRRSPARVHSPLLGVELVFDREGAVTVPLGTGFEHGVLLMAGTATVAGAGLAPGSLLFLPVGRSDVAIEATAGTRAVLLGGEPFGEDLVMWWNFVGRSHEDIVRAREDWAAGRRFGTVVDCDHPPLPAPELPTVRLKPRDRHGRYRDRA